MNNAFRDKVDNLIFILTMYNIMKNRKTIKNIKFLFKKN